MSGSARQQAPVTDTGPVTTESCSGMVEAVDDVATAVQQGAALSEEQLQLLRDATRRLRRAIEVRTITSSTPCRACGVIFVQVDPDAEFCAEACRDVHATESS